METKTFEISQSNRDELNQAGASIANQSVSLGKALLHYREVESGLQTLYVHQQAVFAKILKDAGVEPETVGKLMISPDGSQITVILKPVPSAQHNVPVQPPTGS